MLEFVHTYSKETAAILAVILAFILNRYWKPKVRLVQGEIHSYTFLVDEPLVGEDKQVILPKQTVAYTTHQIINLGSDVAKNVEVTFNWKPAHINIWPSRHFDDKESPNNRYTLCLGILGPKDFVGIELLAVNGQTPEIIIAKSDEVSARKIEFSRHPTPPRWMIVSFVILMLFGLATAAYHLVGLAELALS
jgi:hypothetical protein